jgi:hypothetical protein
MKRLTKLAVLGAAAIAAFGIASADGFTAYLGIQTTSYTFRDPWNSDAYGIEGTSLPDGLTSYDEGMIWWNGNDAEVLPCTFTNAEITGNGDYSVSVSGIDWSKANNDSGLNMLYVDTTIDYDGTTYDYTPGYFSHIQVLFDGDVVYELDESELEDQSPDYLGLYTLEKSDADVLTYCAYNCYGDGNTFDFSSMPSEITINFTVAGLDDSAAASDDTSSDTAAADDTTADTTTSDDSSVADTTAPATTDSSATTGDSTSVVALSALALVALAGVVLTKKARG